MAARTSPTFRRRRLARRLKEMRESAGLTLEEAAPKLDKKRSALSRIEKGETRADVHLVRSMMDIYDIRDDKLLDLARDAAQQGWWRKYGLTDHGYVDIETEAVRVREFQLITIPGLLQTEAYMRAHFNAWHQPWRPAKLDNAVAVRLIRQERLTSEEHPLHQHFIIDEAALRRPAGDQKTMRAQLWHIIAMCELPTVQVQLIPLNAGSHTAMDGAFNVLTFPEPGDPELLYLEYPTGAIHIERVEEVEQAKLVFEHLSATALSPNESVALIEEVRAELYGP